MRASGFLNARTGELDGVANSVLALGMCTSCRPHLESLKGLLVRENEHGRSQQRQQQGKHDGVRGVAVSVRHVFQLLSDRLLLLSAPKGYRQNFVGNVSPEFPAVVAQGLWQVLKWLAAQPELMRHRQAIVETIDWAIPPSCASLYAGLDDSFILEGYQEEADVEAGQEGAQEEAEDEEGAHLRLLRLVVNGQGADLGAVPQQAVACMDHGIVESQRLTIGQLLVSWCLEAPGCLQWLVEDRGVDIQKIQLSAFDDGSPLFEALRASEADDNGISAVARLYFQLKAEQKERFDLADAIVLEGVPSSAEELKELLGPWDLQKLTDRRGRPLLTAAIAEGRPPPVLRSLLAGMRVPEGPAAVVTTDTKDSSSKGEAGTVAEP